jgi:hypothetical protein
MTDAALALSADLAESLATPTDTAEIALRHSHLKLMSQSAAHCRHAMIAGYDDATLSKRIGSGVHSLLLGGDPVLLWTGKQRRGKDYDAWREKQPKEAHVYTKKDYDRTHRIAEAIRANRHAAQVLFAPGTIYEQTINWTWLGRKRRTTPDARSFSHLAELKTTRNASPEKFKCDVLRFGYHAQLADQSLAIETDTGRAPVDVYCCAVETVEPYVVTVYRLTPNDLEQGARLNAAWMSRFQVCEATGQWPGYCETIQDLDLPTGDDEVVFTDDDGEEVATEENE